MENNKDQKDQEIEGENQQDIKVESQTEDAEPAGSAEGPESPQVSGEHEKGLEGPQEDTASESDTEQADGEADSEEGADAAKAEGQPGEKKGFFKKNKKKDKRDEKIEELTDQVKRQMAEFDNFRKRTEKEKAQMYEIGAKSMIEKVLPIVDNFERGLAAVPEENKEDAFVDGMNKIYKQLMTMLEESDVKPIEAVGKEFDPNLHNAVMQTESEEYESGIIAQELQRGYTYRDSVVRHSMVAVVS